MLIYRIVQKSDNYKIIETMFLSVCRCLTLNILHLI